MVCGKVSAVILSERTLVLSTELDELSGPEISTGTSRWLDGTVSGTYPHPSPYNLLPSFSVLFSDSPSSRFRPQSGPSLWLTRSSSGTSRRLVRQYSASSHFGPILSSDGTSASSSPPPDNRSVSPSSQLDGPTLRLSASGLSRLLGSPLSGASWWLNGTFFGGGKDAVMVERLWSGDRVATSRRAICLAATDGQSAKSRSRVLDVCGLPWTLDIRVSRSAMIRGQLCNTGADILVASGACAFETSWSRTVVTFGRFSGIGDDDVREIPGSCTFDMRLSWSAAIFGQLCKEGGGCVGRLVPGEYRDSRSFTRNRTWDVAEATDWSDSEAEWSSTPFSASSWDTGISSAPSSSNESKTSASDASDIDPERSLVS